LEAKPINEIIKTSKDLISSRIKVPKGNDKKNSTSDGKRNTEKRANEVAKAFE